jgi:ABC-2 type transport system permease protein
VRAQLYYIAFKTIVVKEVSRFARIWIQTILPPAITMALYFVIFGNLIGPRVGQMGGFSYIQYIAPGIIMMAVITHSYANVVSSFFGSKFQRHIEEMLIAPIPNGLILAGYISGGVARGLTVGLVVTVVALFFTKLTLYSLPIVAATVLLTSPCSR